MECKWKDVALNVECSGEVKKVDLFPGVSVPEMEQSVKAHYGVSVHNMPICKVHLQVHKDIILAHAQGIDDEESLSMDARARHARIHGN